MRARTTDYLNAIARRCHSGGSANQLGWNFSEVGFKCQIRLACRVLRPSQMENEDSRRKSECFWKNVKTPGASCHVSGKKCVLVAPVVVFSEKSNDSRRESPYFRELMRTHAASLHVFES